MIILSCIESLEGADNATCGNGVVDGAEQCDCGTEEYCNEYEPCCDRENCLFRSTEHVCRGNTPAFDPSCDLPERCNGSSSECPEDCYKRDGYECWEKGAMSYCYSGRCRSHSGQCSYYWGADSDRALDYCYQQLNSMGNKYGNCGVEKDGSFKPCGEVDGYCGKLFCVRDPDKRLEMGVSYSIYTITYINGDEDEGITCVSVNITLEGNKIDPGLVYDGTMCATDSVCVENSCVKLSTDGTNRCPEYEGKECSGNGICNNHFKCQCNDNSYTDPVLCIGAGQLGSMGSQLRNFSPYWLTTVALLLMVL